MAGCLLRMVVEGLHVTCRLIMGFYHKDTIFGGDWAGGGGLYRLRTV